MLCEDYLEIAIRFSGRMDCRRKLLPVEMSGGPQALLSLGFNNFL